MIEGTQLSAALQTDVEVPNPHGRSLARIDLHLELYTWSGLLRSGKIVHDRYVRTTVLSLSALRMTDQVRLKTTFQYILSFVVP